MTSQETTRGQVIEAAKADAKLFVDEFHEAIDPAGTNWDATAWADVVSELRLTADEAETLWPVYQEALVAETKRLAARD